MLLYISEIETLMYRSHHGGFLSPSRYARVDSSEI